MAISFDTAFDLRQLGVRLQYIPAAQVKSRLILAWRQLNGQNRHTRKLCLTEALRNAKTLLTCSISPSPATQGKLVGVNSVSAGENSPQTA